MSEPFSEKNYRYVNARKECQSKQQTKIYFSINVAFKTCDV